MPLASYDYDYYEYINGKRINKASYAQSAAKVRTSTATSQSRRAATTTQTRRSTATTKPQARRSTTDVKRTATAISAKKTTTRKVVTRTTAKSNTTRKPTTTQKRKYDIDIPLKSSSKIVNKPKEMTLKKPKAKSSTSLKNALTNTFALAIFFAIAFCICYRYSIINEEYIKLRNIKKDYETAQNVNVQIQADIESKTDLSYIENYAKYQLGMQKPSDSQIKYVNIRKQDKIITPVTIEEETNANWFEFICNEVGKIID